MGRATPLLIGSLVLLLTSSVTVHADPILYSISGQIRFGAAAYEDFQGSFVLSDPVVSLHDLSDSRGDELDRFVVSDFRLSSASYSLTGSGSIATWWELYRGRGVAVNSLDSLVTLFTSAGVIEHGGSRFPRWEGDPGTQPIGFSGFTEGIGPLGSRSGQILNMTAVARVPEPSALLLCGAGMAGFALLRRRVKS